MYKRVIGGFILLMVLMFAVTAHAASENALEGMSKKFRRGVVNTFTGWIEFPAQIGKGFDEGFRGDTENKLLGMTMGAVDGVAHSIGRTLSGVADMVGFWAADPENNKDIGIPLDAEYAWEKGESYDVFEPNFTEAALSPMVNKLFRGLDNLLFGMKEIPIQITKGIKEGSPELAIPKGIWYWLSREISGVFDIVSVPFANPKDTLGASFEEEKSGKKARAAKEGTF